MRVRWLTGRPIQTKTSIGQNHYPVPFGSPPAPPLPCFPPPFSLCSPAPFFPPFPARPYSYASFLPPFPVRSSTISGILCETSDDFCVSSPCENNGTCVNGSNSYICNCVKGWKGINCTEEKDPCEGDPCLNGGNCTNKVRETSLGGNCLQLDVIKFNDV